MNLTIASFANDLAILYVCYAFLGAGTTCVFLSSLEIVRKCFDKWRSIALGITSAGQGIGTMVISQILQFLVSSLGWKNSLRVMGGCLALNSFFGLLYDSKIDSVSEIHTNEEAGQRRTSKRFTFHCSVCGVPGFLVLTVVFVFAMFGRAIIYVHLVSTCIRLYSFVFGYGSAQCFVVVTAISCSDLVSVTVKVWENSKPLYSAAGQGFVLLLTSNFPKLSLCNTFLVQRSQPPVSREVAFFQLRPK